MPQQRQNGAVPVVSVVMIFLNGEAFIEEAVQSVRDQELADWELILVDDGSTDRSTQLARDLVAKDGRIRYVDHPGHENRGMSASRNLGAAHARASYLAFLDADDVWMPTKLAEQVALLESMPDVAMVSGAIEFWYSWDPASTKTDDIRLPGVERFVDRRLDPPEAALELHPLKLRTPGRRHTCAVMEILIRRSVFDAVGGFEESFRGHFEDQAFYMKVFLRYPIYLSSRCWLRYRQHDASCQGKATRKAKWRRRGEYLDWVQGLVDGGWLDDPRVNAAVRRSRRQIPYLVLAASIVQTAERFRVPRERFHRGVQVSQ